MRVLIVGMGNIGRRHYEGLRSSRTVTGIAVVDPDGPSLMAATRLPRSCRSVTFHRTIPDGTFDVGIIATNAQERRWVVDQIKNRCKFLILEKFLFCDLEEYNIILPNAWVNCPRRAMPCYQAFSAYHGRVSWIGHSNLPGMLSNAVHYADLLSYLTGDVALNFEVQINHDIPNKRRGYTDAHGFVRIQSHHGTCLLRSGEGSPGIITIDGHEIDEESRKISRGVGMEYDFNFMYQSQLTGQYIDDLEKTGDPGLTSFEQSSRWHVQFLKELRRVGWDKAIT